MTYRMAHGEYAGHELRGRVIKRPFGRWGGVVEIDLGSDGWLAYKSSWRWFSTSLRAKVWARDHLISLSSAREPRKYPAF